MIRSLTLDHLYKNLLNNINDHYEVIRDLTLIHLDNNYSLVIAVDSDGGIGSLKNDAVKVDPYVLGRFAMRVPLLELLSSGAKPLAAFDMLSMPMNEVGTKIVKGVRDELALANLSSEFPLSGSTEDNVPTSMTSIGTTIVGMVNKNDFTVGKSQKGDIVVCVGLPKSAPDDEVKLDDPDIVTYNDIQSLLSINAIHEILPVGSKGIKNEIYQLAESVSLNVDIFENQNIDLNKSGGPSTCVLVSGESEILRKLNEILKVPVNVIANLY